MSNEMPDLAIQPLTIIGPPPERDDDEWLLLLALLLLRDVEESRLWWGTIAPARYRTMLTGWTYNPDLMQWTRPSRTVARSAPSGATATLGQPLSSATVKQGVILAVQEAENEVGKLTRLMTAGAITLRVWFDGMLSMVKRTQVAAAAVAWGGVDRIPVSELARTTEAIPAGPETVQSTGDMVAYQADRLSRFTRQIADGGERADTVDAIERRAKLYVTQAIAGYEEARRRNGAAIGVKDAINVLDSEADHCRARETDPRPDCPSITRAGWMPLEAMPPVGMRICGPKCRCRVDFRLADGTELP